MVEKYNSISFPIDTHCICPQEEKETSGERAWTKR